MVAARAKYVTTEIKMCFSKAIGNRIDPPTPTHIDIPKKYIAHLQIVFGIHLSNSHLLSRNIFKLFREKLFVLIQKKLSKII